MALSYGGLPFWRPITHKAKSRVRRPPTEADMLLQRPPTEADMLLQRPPTEADMLLQRPPTEADMLLQRPPTEADMLLQRPPTEADRLLQRPPTEADMLVQRPPTEADMLLQRPPTEADMLVQRPPTEADMLVQRPPTEADMLVQRPPTEADRLLQRPPTEADMLLQRPPTEADRLLQRPPTEADMLLQQVRDQSDACDVTVHVGSWSKKFHWHVLAKSPFFECVQRNDFIEKQTGLVRMNLTTPANTEAAILSLYGMKARLTTENVSEILDMSEFLLIPDLKSECVSFLQNLPITEQNYMQMIETASLYDFELSACYDFIRRHLHEMLPRADVLNLTTESIIILLSEPHRTPRITTEEKFEFIVRWINHNKSKQEAFNEVFDAIDLETMNIEYFETVFLQHPIVSELSVRHSNITALHKTHRVLLFPNLTLYRDNIPVAIPCFDIQTENWCMTEWNEYFDDTTQLLKLNQSISETLQIYSVEDWGTLRLTSTHLKTKSSTMCKLISPLKSVGYDKTLYRINGNAFIALSLNIECHCSENAPILLRRKRCDSRGVHTKYRYMSSTLSHCKIQYPSTNLKPLLSLRDTTVHSVCINNDIIAMVTRRNTLLLYDVENCQLVNISLHDHLGNAAYRGEIYAIEQGFVFHNNHRLALDISRKNQSIFSYVVTKVNIDRKIQRTLNRHILTSAFFNGTWYRASSPMGAKAELEERRIFECADHSELMNANGRDVHWKQLPPFPKSRHFLCDDIVMLHLPRSMLFCDIDCPCCCDRI